MRTDHWLKIWPEFFDAHVRGLKSFEVRKDDRGYVVGDVLLLREWIPKACTDCTGEHGAFTGRVLPREVTYVMQGGRFGLAPGWVVLGLRRPMIGWGSDEECLRGNG